MRGFFVPNSISSSYVANKRDQAGTLQYEGIANRLGVERQSALQNLNQNYSTTINNAYTSYLAANRGVLGSSLGQGYKEAYIQENQAQLAKQFAEGGQSLAGARSEIAVQEAKATEQVQKSFESEVGKMDRVASSLGDYRSYLSGLIGKPAVLDKKGNVVEEAKPYFVDDPNKSIDTMYEDLFNAMPKDTTDQSGGRGLSYREWLHNQKYKNESDLAWQSWAEQEGYDEFRNMHSRSKALSKDESLVKEKLRLEQVQKQKAERELEIKERLAQEEKAQEKEKARLQEKEEKRKKDQLWYDERKAERIKERRDIQAKDMRERRLREEPLKKIRDSHDSYIKEQKRLEEEQKRLEKEQRKLKEKLNRSLK